MCTALDHCSKGAKLSLVSKSFPCCATSLSRTSVPPRGLLRASRSHNNASSYCSTSGAPRGNLCDVQVRNALGAGSRQVHKRQAMGLCLLGTTVHPCGMLQAAKNLEKSRGPMACQAAGFPRQAGYGHRDFGHTGRATCRNNGTPAALQGACRNHRGTRRNNHDDARDGDKNGTGTNGQTTPCRQTFKDDRKDAFRQCAKHQQNHPGRC